MQLSIKRAETHQLAVELARKTGDTIQGAVTKAIRAELKRLQTQRAKQKV